MIISLYLSVVTDNVVEAIEIAKIKASDIHIADDLNPKNWLVLLKQMSNGHLIPTFIGEADNESDKATS